MQTPDIGIIITLVLSITGLIILTYDLRARRALQREDLELRKQQFEQEQKERAERLEWLRRETLKLQETAEPLADQMAARLIKNNEWAAVALEKAKLGPHAATLFGERRGHFREEKEELADNFIPLLLQRCRNHIRAGRPTYLLIDSGTTIYPFFSRLGQAAIRGRANKEDWIDHFTVVTNNLPGVEKLMESGRLDPNNRYSELALKCELLPGVPLPIYSAVVGHKANMAIQAIRQEAPKGSVFIGLLTGNWIRLRRSNPPCPIPLARGEGHRQFKKTLIDNSDEVYVISPLGKIFVRLEPEKVNAALGLSDNNIDPDRQPYSEVLIDDSKAAHVKLVSTSRPDSFVLSKLSFLVQEQLAVSSEKIDEPTFISADSKDLPHLLFPFTKLPENWYFQLEAEFPHPQTRREEFMNRYFFVPMIKH